MINLKLTISFLLPAVFILLLTACGDSQPLPDIDATVEARVELAKASFTPQVIAIVKEVPVEVPVEIVVVKEVIKEVIVEVVITATPHPIEVTTVPVIAMTPVILTPINTPTPEPTATPTPEPWNKPLVINTISNLGVPSLEIIQLSKGFMDFIGTRYYLGLLANTGDKSVPGAEITFRYRNHEKKIEIGSTFARFRPYGKEISPNEVVAFRIDVPESEALTWDTVEVSIDEGDPITWMWFRDHEIQDVLIEDFACSRDGFTGTIYNDSDISMGGFMLVIVGYDVHGAIVVSDQKSVSDILEPGWRKEFDTAYNTFTGILVDGSYEHVAECTIAVFEKEGL